MTTHVTLVFALLCESACVDMSEPDVMSDRGTHALTVETSGATSGDGNEDEPDICGFLPPDGPCSLACDPDALREQVPVGVCVAYVCTLTDGRIISVHACHPLE